MNLKKTLSKVYKSGFFHSFELTKNTLLFKDCHNNIYTLFPFKSFFLFRIGHVENWQDFAPTYESEYNSLGWINRSKFIDHVKPMYTNNPDYILRVSLEYLLPNNL